jgi:hypothetical protein
VPFLLTAKGIHSAVFLWLVPAMLKVGQICRLEFPGIAARVIEAPIGLAPVSFPFLMESLFLRSRWYVNAHGEPAYADSPRLILKPAPVQPRRGEDRASLCWRRR